MSKDARFWRNVTLIALAHIALLVGLIRWSLHAKSLSNAQRNAQSIVWFGSAKMAAGKTKSAPPKRQGNTQEKPRAATKTNSQENSIGKSFTEAFAESEADSGEIR